MAYPTVPDLQPFAGNVTPDLRANGPYDTTLTQIENYLKQLGAYVDAQIAEVRGEIPSSTDFATAEQLETVSQSASAAASAAATAQQTAEEASTAADEAKADVTELGNELNTLDGTVSEVNNKVNKMIKINGIIPSRVNDDVTGLVGSAVYMFAADGSTGTFFSRLNALLSNIMLAAPNDDKTKLFGCLGDNTTDLTSTYGIKSSAALTAAYEAGGITKASDDPAFTAADLAACKVSAEGVPYKNQEA